MGTSIVLAQLVDAPALVHGIRALAPPAFAALVREIGVEDAGPLIGLATTEQLVASFDEDLFGNAAPGERETFDAERFATWLEVLLEAGDAIAARRVSELSLDFVVHALGQLVLVLDHQALLERMSEGGREARRADKAIESSLSEEIDGYLLIARRHDGWDAVLSLILALDRDHRTFLERVLDRCTAIAEHYVDDLAALAGVLSDEAMVGEDAEAEREARRAARGYVEPRAARAFLATASGPFTPARDPITRAYFRELGPAVEQSGVPEELREALARALPVAPETALPAPLSPVLEALRALAPEVYAPRLAELTYLANVVVAGATIDGRRYTPHEASTEVLAVVERGLAMRGARELDAMIAVLAAVPCDELFRQACSGGGERVARVVPPPRNQE